MSLSSKYNEFYKHSLGQETLRDIEVHGWPKNRTEAIISVEGCGETILDIGCGDGLLLYQFRNRYSRLIGLEYSDKRLEYASRNLKEYKFTGILGSAEEISALESESIDRVVSADTIEHIPDVYKALDEIYRVLKPGGLLVINTPNVAFIKKRIFLLFGRFPSTSQPNEGVGDNLLFDGGHLHYFTFRSFRLILQRSGFKMVRHMGYGPLGRFHNIWPSMLSGGVQWVAKK